MLLVVSFSLALGTAAARSRGSVLDLLLRGVSYLAWAVPAFLLGLVVQQLISAAGSSRGIGPFPVAGWPGICPASIGLNGGTITPCPAAGSGVHYVLNVLRYVTLPALTLAVGFVGLHARHLRAGLLDALDAPYITTARAKGLPERTVVLRHALRASLSTFAGALFADFGAVFGASLAVDWVFQLHGLGTNFIEQFNPFGQFNLDSMEALLLVTAVLVIALFAVERARGRMARPAREGSAVSAGAEAPTPLVAAPPPRARGRWHQALRRLGREPATLVALVLLVGLFVVGALAPHIAPQGWNAINLSSRWANHPPVLSGWHLLGTDNIGRDVLVRTLYGLHDTEGAALLGALLATLLGVLVGGAAGYYGGWLDLVLMRLTDLLTAFPAMVLMLAAFVFLAPMSATKATLVFAGYMWTFVARVVRARIAPLSIEEFVQAARALGASDARIFFKPSAAERGGNADRVGHVAHRPGRSCSRRPSSSSASASRSANRPTLGNLIADATSSGIGAYNFLDLGWWVWAGPASVLVLILVCTNLVGDGLDAALNPRAASR